MLGPKPTRSGTIMVMRCAPALLVLLVACQARLGNGSGDDIVDAPAPDSKIYRDAGIDAPPDARLCAGGTTAQVGPDGSCFVLVTTSAGYTQANQACAAMNAHLAYIKTADIDTFAEGFVGTR